MPFIPLMESAEEFEQRRADLRAEVNDEPFFGPYVRRNGRSGQAGPELAHTGYSLSATTATRTLDAWILRPASYWWTEQALVVPFAQVGFPFFYFQPPYVPLLSLLDNLVALRTKPIDVPALVLELEPVLKGVRASPLKKNSRECLLPVYRDLGFAVAPAKLHKASAVMRVVWVYPEYRDTRAITHYLPVGTLKFPLDGAGNLQQGIFDLASHNRLLGRLGLNVPGEHRAHAWQMLTDTGQNELLTLLKSKREGGHPRTKEKEHRLQFVAQHPALWDQPKKLARLLREAGLYSAKITGTQLVWQTQHLIDRLKSARTTDNAPVAPEGPA